MISPLICFSQTFEELYSQFKNQAQDSYNSFRSECNSKYIEFLKTAWKSYELNEPISLPKELTPIPPKPYENNFKNTNPIQSIPIAVNPIIADPQPKPISPIREVTNPVETNFHVDFYGISTKIRLSKLANFDLVDCQPNTIASTWEILCADEMNNTIRDCLETRLRYNFSDWTYLLFLEELGKQFCKNSNNATFLTAFLFCQSGYQVRFAVDKSNLVLLFGSKHQIFDRGYFIIDGNKFYPLGTTSNSLKICNATYEGETPLSLLLDKEQLLGSKMSSLRGIKSTRYPDFEVQSQVPENLIELYNTYPTSAIDGNPMTRWAMYANAPLSQKTKDILYPSIKNVITGLSNKDAVEKLLNWVQTGFVYEYDDKVWGQDRAFFAEETLYYSFADCEDRSILFSRLVRDLLGLDVALIYYPGHLATAVKFDTEVQGDAMLINGDRYVVCDPTYIGAPVGAQMPELEYDKAEAIVLKR